MSEQNKLKQVIDYMGGTAQLAEALGIEPQAIYQWKGRIPPRRAYEIERLTDGHFSADDLMEQVA